MKRLILCLFFLIAHFLAQPSQGGPLRSLVRSCPGGVCPTKTIEVPVEAIIAPATEQPEKVWGITGYAPGPCPRCPPVPVYGWIEKQSAEQPSEKAIDEAASRLAKGGLSREEEKKLAAVIDAPAVKKARAGHWAAGTCKMLCEIPSHGTHWVWDDPVDDGTPEPAWGSWGGSSGGVLRPFRRRR